MLVRGSFFSQSLLCDDKTGKMIIFSRPNNLRVQ
jgi:hypothetical protein